MSEKEKDKNKKKNAGSGRHWVLHVFLMSVTLSAVLSFLSSTALSGSGYVVAILVLVFFIALGIVSPFPLHGGSQGKRWT